VGEQPKYRELEHTGDLAIEVTAATREELFAHSLVAMARLMVEQNAIAAAERREIRVDAGDDADTIRDLLAAALNLFLIDGFISRRRGEDSGWRGRRGAHGRTIRFAAASIARRDKSGNVSSARRREDRRRVARDDRVRRVIGATFTRTRNRLAAPNLRSGGFPSRVRLPLECSVQPHLEFSPD
jgi:SHS2 domain-containing protein